jgi:hypothetical protein
LRGDPFRHPEDVSGMLIIIPHECLTAELPFVWE